MQPAFQFLKPASKPRFLDLTGKKRRTAKNAVFIVTWSLLWCFHGIFELTQIGLFDSASEMGIYNHFRFSLFHRFLSFVHFVSSQNPNTLYLCSFCNCSLAAISLEIFSNPFANSGLSTTRLKSKIWFLSMKAISACAKVDLFFPWWTGVFISRVFVITPCLFYHKDYRK